MTTGKPRSRYSAKFDRRTSAASAPSMNTSMKVHGRTCTRMRNTVSWPRACRRRRTGINIYSSAAICSRGATTVVRNTSAARSGNVCAFSPSAAPIKVVSREAAVHLHFDQGIGIAQQQQHQRADSQGNCGVDGRAFGALQGGAASRAAACGRARGRRHSDAPDHTQGQTISGDILFPFAPRRQGGCAPVSINRRVNKYSRGTMLVKSIHSWSV